MIEPQKEVLNCHAGDLFGVGRQFQAFLRFNSVVDFGAPPEQECRYIRTEKCRLDKSLAHLTTTRVKYESDGKKWDVETMMREIESMIDRFLAGLRDRPKEWFKDT
jgi:hypothetical protein